MPDAEAARDVTVVEERHHRRTEKPIAEEVGGKVHHDACTDVPLTQSAEKMYAIVAGKHQQRCPHEPAREQEIAEDVLLRNTCKEHVQAEEKHQREGDAE